MWQNIQGDEVKSVVRLHQSDFLQFMGIVKSRIRIRRLYKHMVRYEANLSTTDSKKATSSSFYFNFVCNICCWTFHSLHRNFALKHFSI